MFVEYVIIISSQNVSLYNAAAEGNVERVRQCISDGADVNYNKVSFQLLDYIIMHGQKLLKYLLFRLIHNCLHSISNYIGYNDIPYLPHAV